jgi:hypothetical protein
LEDRRSPGSSGFSGEILSVPIPGQELVNALGGMIGQAREDVGEPGLRIDVVELGGGNQAVDGGRPSATLVGTGERSILSSHSDRAQFTLGSVV